MQTTACSKVLYSADSASTIEAIKRALPSTEFQLAPSLEQLLSADTRTFKYTEQFELVKNDPILILHSSGSTGSPGPVTLTHATFATYDYREFPKIPGRRNLSCISLDENEAGSRLWETFPPYHLAGFVFKVVLPLFTHIIPVFGPPLRPPSGALTKQVFQSLDIQCSILPPAIIEELYHEEGGLLLLKNLGVLGFSGGPLSAAIGREIAKYTLLCQLYGSTEIGEVRQLMPKGEDDDWAYMEFHPHGQIEFQLAEDDAFELVVFASPETAAFSALNHNCPGVTRFYTKELFRPHPSKRGLWKFHARRDDIIVLSSWEKINPISMENFMIGVAGVRGALVFGEGHAQVGLLLEIDGHEYVQEILFVLAQANELMPGPGRVSKAMIILSKSDKPFVRSAKGSIIRKQTEALYKNEIAALFKSHCALSSEVSASRTGTQFGFEALREMLRLVFVRLCNTSDWDNESNIFVHGMDSVKTSEAVDDIRLRLMTTRPNADFPWLSPELIYRNPTIQNLTTTILRLLNKRSRGADNQLDAAVVLKQTISRGMEQLAGLQPSSQRYCIALTGSTGYLGRNLLTQLSRNPLIERIYSLDRSPRAEYIWEQQQKQQHSSQPTKPISFWTVDFTHPHLNLSPQQHAELTSCCNAILHSAWRVDFNLSLSSFTDSLAGLANMIRLAHAGAQKPRLLFISSISAAGLPQTAPPGGRGGREGGRGGGEPQSHRTIPEGPLPLLSDSSAAAAAPLSGYGASKLAAEHVLCAAHAQLGLRVSVLRLGQLCPSTTAPAAADVAWPRWDAVPVMLRTSKQLGVLPGNLGAVQ